MDDLKKFLQNRDIQRTILNDPTKNAALLELLELDKEIKNLNKIVYESDFSPETTVKARQKLLKLYEVKDQMERSLPKIGIEDFKLGSSKDYTDKELIKMAQDFLKLDEQEMKKLHIGRGAFKDAYELPNTNLILKKAGGVGNKDDIIKDYYMNKRMEDLFVEGASDEFAEEAKKNKDWASKFLERPKMVAIPDEEPLLIQKKLIGDSYLDMVPWTRRDYDTHEIPMKYNDLVKKQLKEEFRPADLHSGNVGIDPDTGNLKAFDAQGSPAAHRDYFKLIKEFKEKMYKNFDPKVFRALAPLAPVAKVAGRVGVPLVGAYSSYSEAKDMGLPKPIAAAYAAAEEFNPTPISGIDFYKGMEESAKGRAKNMAQNYRTKEQIVEDNSLKNYGKSAAAKDKAFGTLRKLLNGYMLDENVPKKKIKRSYFNPETGDYEYEYE